MRERDQEQRVYRHIADRPAVTTFDRQMLGRAAERVQSSVIKRPFAIIEANWHRGIASCLFDYEISRDSLCACAARLARRSNF